MGGSVLPDIENIDTHDVDISTANKVYFYARKNIPIVGTGGFVVATDPTTTVFSSQKRGLAEPQTSQDLGAVASDAPLQWMLTRELDL